MRTLFLIAVGAACVFAQSTSSNLFTVIPKTDLSATGELRFRDKVSTPHYVGFKAPDSVSANQLYKLPPATAVGCVQDDGTGTWTIASCGAAAVVNGFQVTGSSAIMPPVTTVGWQAWYNNTDHSTNWLSYDNANALSPINISASSVNFTGNITQPSGTSPWCALAGCTMAGNINANAVGTLSLGSAATPFGSTFALTNSSSRKFQIYDSSATDLSGLFWVMKADITPGSFPTVDLKFTDSLGTDVLVLAREFLGTPGKQGVLDADWLPKIDNTYDVGNGSFQWRNLKLASGLYMGNTLVLDSGRNLTVASCSGCGGVDHGFFVNDNASVGASTAMGLQVSYVTSSHSTVIKSYDASNALSPINLSASTLSFTGNITQPSGTSPWCALAGCTMAGNISANAVGTLSLGSAVTPFGSTFALTNSSSRKFQIYDSSATDLSGIFWSMKADITSGTFSTVDLKFTDSTGTDVLVLARSFLGTPGKQGVLDADWLPKIDNTYDVGNGSFQWRNLKIASGLYMGNTLVLDSGRNLTVASCTGCGGVDHGFFVTDNASVGASTAMGLQVSYVTSSHSTVIKSYDASNALSPINLSASTFSLTGNITQPSGTSPWCALTGCTMSGNINANAVGTLSLGSAATPFGSTFALTNSSSRKFQIYDSSATDLSGIFWSMKADITSGSFATVDLKFTDSTGTDVLVLARSFLGAPGKQGVLDADWLPSANNTYDVGNGSFQWRNLKIASGLYMGNTLVLDSSRNLTVASCSGCGGTVTNGFFVTGNSAVLSSTAQGYQTSFDTSTSTTLIKSYNASAAFSPISIYSSALNLVGTPAIVATGSGPFSLTGSTVTNGNILLTPGNVAGNSSVIVLGTRTDRPSFLITNPFGTTTSNALEIDNNGGTAVFKVIGSGDTGCPNCVVSYNHFPHDTSATDSLGDSAHRWGKLWVKDIDMSGTFSGAIWLPLGGGTMSGNINSATVGTLSLGNTTAPFGSTFALTNSSSRKFQVYDSGAADLSGLFWTIKADDTSGVSATVALHFTDSAGTDALVLARSFLGAAGKQGVLDADWLPKLDNTYDVGNGSFQWRNLKLATGLYMGNTLVLDSGRNLTVASCSGCSSGVVTNGFFVQGNSAVTPTPTAPGFQVSHDPSSHTSFIKSFNASNLLSPIDISGATFFNQQASFSGGINLNSTPTISTTFANGPMQIFGPSSSNGNILITPGAVTNNASVRILQTTVGQPALKIINPASTATASTVFEVDNSNQTTARFWVESDLNPTTTTGCPSCVHTASLLATSDGVNDIGADTLRYRLFKGFGAQLGLVPLDVPSGTVAQMGTNGISLVVVDGYSNGIPSFLGRNASGTYASPSSTVSGGVLFSLSGRGYVTGSGFMTSGSAAISMLANENWGSGQGADIYLQTTAAGASFSSRATRAIVTSTGVNPPFDNTGSLGSSGPCVNGGGSPCRWNNANFVNATIGTLTVTSCSGCASGGGVTALGAFAPIQVSASTGPVSISCNTCVATNALNTYTFLQTFSAGIDVSNSLTFRADTLPDVSNTRSLGSLSKAFQFVVAQTLVATNATLGTGVTVGGVVDFHVGSGNFYLRSFGGAPTCSGVGDGWAGIDTSGSKLWVCIGGVAKSTTLF